MCTTTVLGFTPKISGSPRIGIDKGERICRKVYSLGGIGVANRDNVSNALKVEADSNSTCVNVCVNGGGCGIGKDGETGGMLAIGGFWLLKKVL